MTRRTLHTPVSPPADGPGAHGAAGLAWWDKRKYWQPRLWLRRTLPSTLARVGLVGPLPSFLIIGAQRGGTTYLHDLLLDHPQIAGGLVKEIKYFEQHFDRGLDWYRANFALSHLVSRRLHAEPILLGEATADYLFSPCVPRRVAEAIPEVKLIALLRNPVERAYSHYQMVVHMGRETLPFEHAIAAEKERLSVPPGACWPDEAVPTSADLRFSYLSKGLYADQLRRWQSVFPAAQLLVINSERLYTATQTVLDEVTTFLGVPPWTPHGRKKTNSQSYQPMTPETRQTLIEFFRPYNESLYQLLGTTFDWEPQSGPRAIETVDRQALVEQGEVWSMAAQGPMRSA